MSGVPKGSVHVPVLFRLFINQLNGGLEYSLSTFADYAKQGGVVDRADDRAAVQRDPVRVEKWANRSLVNLIPENAKFCTWGGVIPCSSTCWQLSGQERTWRS